MTPIAESQSSNQAISTSPYTNALDQKVTHVAADLLTPCLKQRLKGKMDEKTIEEASNYLQNKDIQSRTEHYTIQKRLLTWNKDGHVGYDVLNMFHAAFRECKNPSGTPAHQLSTINHSDK